MLLLAIFLIAAGMLMLWKPAIVWNISEPWKSQNASEPSSLYLWSVRFGGLLCALIGLASALAYFFA